MELKTSPIKNKVGGVFIPVGDIQNAKEWYCKILGLPEEGENLFGHLYVPVMEEGSPALILDQMPRWCGGEQKPPTYQTPAFMFNTDAVHASFRFMQENGVELVTEVEDNQWFVFKDPDGNLLMVCQ